MWIDKNRDGSPSHLQMAWGQSSLALKVAVHDHNNRSNYLSTSRATESNIEQNSKPKPTPITVTKGRKFPSPAELVSEQSHGANPIAII